MCSITLNSQRFTKSTVKDEQDPFFCRREGPIYERFPNVDLPSFVKVFGQLLDNTLKNTLPDPLLESPVACLVWRIPLGKIFPGRASTQYPRYHLAHAVDLVVAGLLDLWVVLTL